MKFHGSVAVILIFVSSVTMASEAGGGLSERDVSLRFAPINSLAQLDAHLAFRSPESPLMLLSDNARKTFVDSLVFTHVGLAGFSYEPIVRELSTSEAYRLLSLFGAQRTIAVLPPLRRDSTLDDVVSKSVSLNPVVEDHPGYACTGRATCSSFINSICMSGC
ncbi:TPA: hypothetical protein ACKP39_003444 [Stenotrophomonas maltophilia]